jgi:hypothetical protein
MGSYWVIMGEMDQGAIFDTFFVVFLFSGVYFLFFQVTLSFLELLFPLFSPCLPLPSLVRFSMNVLSKHDMKHEKREMLLSSFHHPAWYMVCMFVCEVLYKIWLVRHD